MFEFNPELKGEGGDGEDDEETVVVIQREDDEVIVILINWLKLYGTVQATFIIITYQSFKLH